MDDKRKWVRWVWPVPQGNELVRFVDHDRVRTRFVARYGYEPQIIEDRTIFGKPCTVAGPVRGE